ncbi:MAG: hypothetical protein K2K54_08150 [Lachnospiraceae bacterium]|nr:hypothetical protein [Lachnospiraceae bacterium]
MKNMYYIWGMILGIIFGIFIVIITSLIRKYSSKNRYKERFDERQTLARLRGFKLGFFTMMIYNAIYAFYSLFVEKTVFTTFAAMVIGIILGITVFAVYAILKDAYVALDKGRKNFLVLFGACGILNLMNGIRGIHEEMTLTENGDPQIYVLNFSAALLSGVVFITFVLKGLTRKKEEEE